MSILIQRRGIMCSYVPRLITTTSPFGNFPEQIWDHLLLKLLNYNTGFLSQRQAPSYFPQNIPEKITKRALTTMGWSTWFGR